MTTTPIGNFDELENIDDGFLWNDKTAVKFLYKFVMPRKSKDTEQTNVKEGLDSWLLDSDDWDNIEGFSLNDFNLINKNALDIIEGSTLDFLADGRNFNANKLTWDFKQYEFLTDNRTGVIQIANWKEAVKNITGEIELLKDPSKMTEDDIKIIWNIKDKDWEKNPFKPDDEAIKERIEYKEKIVEESRAKVEQFKNAQFDGSSTLKTVIGDETQAEKFFAVFLSVPELESQAAITLADATDYEIENFEDDPEAFFLMFGVHFDEYKKAVKASTEKLALLVATQTTEPHEEGKANTVDEERLRKIWIADSELQEEFNGDFNAWVQTEIIDNKDAQMYLKQLGERAGKQLESVRDLTPQESYTGEDVPESMRTFKRKIDRRKRHTKREGKEEFFPYGQELTTDEIKDSVGDVTKNIQLKPAEGWIEQSKQRQVSGEKYKLEFESIDKKGDLINFKNTYLKHAGFTSEKGPQIIMRGTPLKGSFSFDVKKHLENKMIDKIPYIANLQIFNHLISSLGKYSRRKVKTTAESLEDKLVQWKSPHGRWLDILNGTSGVESDTFGLLPIAHELFKLIDRDTREGTEGINENTQKIINDKIKYILGDYDDSYWYDGDKIKKTGNEWFELLTKWKSASTGESKFMDNLLSLSRLIGRLLNVIDEHVNDVENIEEEEEEVLDELKDKNKTELKALAKDLDINIKGIKGENEIRRAIAEEASRKQIKDLEDSMEQQERVDESAGDDEGGLLWSEDKGFEVFESDVDTTSLLSMYLEEMSTAGNLDDLRVAIKESAGLIKGTEKIFSQKSYSLSNRNLNKATRKLLTYLDFENEFSHSDLKELNKMGVHTEEPILDAMASSTSEEENTDEINNILASFRDALEKVWNRKSKENKKVLFGDGKRRYFTPILKELDFENLLLDKISNSALNNSYNAGINLHVPTGTSKLTVVINFIDKEIQLKGKLDWSSKSQYRPTTKIVGARSSGITPSISTLDISGTAQARIKERAGKSVGLRVTAVGKEGGIVLEEGDYIDVERMDWLNTLIDNIANLRRILS